MTSLSRITLDGERCVRVPLRSDPDGRYAILAEHQWPAIRKAVGARLQLRQGLLTGGISVVGRREHRGETADLAVPVARLTTHAVPREVLRPIGDPLDLRPSNWILRNVETGRKRRGVSFAYSDAPRRRPKPRPAPTLPRKPKNLRSLLEWAQRVPAAQPEHAR